MAASWQLWLSPRPKNRTNTTAQPTLYAASDEILYEFQQEDDGRRTIKETHFLDNDIVRKGLSGPPLHIHLKQKEYFQVEKGVLGVVKNGREYALTSADPPVLVEPGVRHRFWAHASTKEDLIFKVWVDPQDLDHGFDENFMRHLTSYSRDCKRENIAPSIFQILLFMYHRDIVLTPPFWLPLWVLTGFHYIFGCWVGAGLLGYQASYPEYSIMPVTGRSKARKTA